MKPKALILHATGTNRDLDAAAALELAGAQPEIVHLNQLRHGERRWLDYQVLVVPGGFSYADALGAGRLFALDLNVYFAEEVGQFVASGKPVIGICNGFQAMVKAGILPGQPAEIGQTPPAPARKRSARKRKPSGPDRKPGMRATLTFNASGHFECRWVTLVPQSQKCVWTRGLDQPLLCPVAHGEGNFVLSHAEEVDRLRAQDQIALVYATPDCAPALGAYPYNPNGSSGDIAGICNPQGNVLGLMPHPEDHIYPYQHPRWTRGEQGQMGIILFENGVKYAKDIT